MFIPLVPKTSYLGDDLLTPWGDWFEVTVIYFFFLPLRDTPRYWGRRLFRPGVSRSFGARRQLTSQSTKRLAQRWMQSLLSSRWRAKEFTSMSESLKWKCLQGLTLKARSMNRTPRSLILSLPSEPKIGWGIWTQFGPMGEGKLNGPIFKS